MLNTTSLFHGGPLRLILLVLLGLGVCLRPVPAQNAKSAPAKETIKEVPNEAPAAADGGGVMIPADTVTGGAGKPIPVPKAQAIDNPALEESGIEPVSSNPELKPPTALPPGTTAPAPVLAPVATPLTAPAPVTTLAAPETGLGFSESTEDSETSSGAALARTPSQALTGMNEGEMAPYMRDLKAIDIFDSGKGEDTTPLQQVAKTFADRQAAAERALLRNMKNLTTYEYELEGPNEEKIRQEAQTRALVSAAGKVYFDDYLIVGRDLLEPYLRQNGKPFIARTSVLDHRAISSTRTAMRLRVSVNMDLLYHDLQNKHFVAKPSLRPNVAVLMHEIVNGESSAAAGGRGRVERTLEQNMYQIYSDKMRKPGLDADITGTDRLLKQARMEAERNNVDVLISGTLIVQPVNVQQIYYNNYAFKEAEITLKMYRVDTGELLDEAKDHYSAAAGQEAEATKKVLDAMISRTAQKMADDLNKTWPKMMLLQDNYRLMFNGVSAGEVTSIRNLLKTLSPGSEIFQKAYMGDVLVLNLIAPDVTPEKVEAFLRGASEPQFNVKKIAKRRLVLDAL